MPLCDDLALSDSAHAGIRIASEEGKLSSNFISQSSDFISHMTLPRLFTLLLSSIVLVGCVTANVTRLNQTSRPPTTPDQVTVYLDEADIEGEYEKMAVINLEGASGWTDESDIYKKAREEAAKIGANGVLFETMEEAGTGERVASALFGTGSDTDSKMVAIYVEGKSEDAPAVDTTSEQTTGGLP